MTYVLVSLLGDKATETNDDFARWFETEHPPAAAFHGEHPDHDAVAAAVRKAPIALVFGHDGGGLLRGAIGGPRWADPAEFARMFVGARVWVYACETRARKLEEDLESFGRQAHTGGVNLFAGYCSAITAVPLLEPGVRDSVYRALGRTFRAFIQGESRAGELRRVAKIGTVGGRSTALTAMIIERDMASLRVLT